MVSTISTAFICVITLLNSDSANPAARGLEIAVEADRRDTGWGDSQAELVMVLRNRNGDESRRDLRTNTLEQDAAGDKSLIIFDHPPDVKNTALLTFTNINEPDDQWLYLPALKRVKRISTSNKSGPFMGSEFAYEDLTSQEVEEFTWQYLGDETVHGLDCYKVQRIPLDEKSGYTRQVVWYDKVEYRIEQIEYFDRKGELLKTLELADYRQYKDQFWRAHTMHMENHQTGKSTTLEWKNIAFGTGLTERDFDQASLRRAR